MLAHSTSADLPKDWNVVQESTRDVIMGYRISTSMKSHQVCMGKEKLQWIENVLSFHWIKQHVL